MTSVLPTPEASTHPVEVGTRTEALILAELVSRGYAVLTPFGVNHRYDLVLDVDGRFVRAQCKTARLRNGCVCFSGFSVRSNLSRSFMRRYDGEVELLLAYCPDNRRIYAVPVGDETPSHVSLRISPTSNGQVRGIRWASDYELPA